jgi:hypothetical protein
MPNLTTRTFEVVYEGPSITSADSTGRFAKTVYAAYFQQGLGMGEDSDGLVTFKDTDHKPVFTVRAGLVITIEEIRDQQAAAAVTPEMQARVTACSGAVTPLSNSTTYTTGGPAITEGGLREAVWLMSQRNGAA